MEGNPLKDSISYYNKRFGYTPFTDEPTPEEKVFTWTKTYNLWGGMPFPNALWIKMNVTFHWFGTPDGYWSEEVLFERIGAEST